MTNPIISSAEIARFMNWRGPGAYTQRIEQRIMCIVDEVERRVRQKYVELDAELADLYEAALKQARTIMEKQADIDRLMLEYCPDEMTQEQVAEWGRNQKAVHQEPVKIPAFLRRAGSFGHE